MVWFYYLLLGMALVVVCDLWIVIGQSLTRVRSLRIQTRDAACAGEIPNLASRSFAFFF